jgi:hypothetical protein
MKHSEFISTDDMNLYKLCALLSVVNMDHKSQNSPKIMLNIWGCLGTDF